MARCKVAFVGLCAIPIAVLFFPTFVIADAPETFTGRVVKIIDGDTVDVLRDGVPVRLRLYGIDAPERGQPFGKRAKEFTADQAGGEVVTVTVRDIDRWKRIVGEVELSDGRNLNFELVQAGFAWHYVRYAPDRLDFADAEKAAREAKRGLWIDSSPVAPWELRKQKRD